MFFVLFLQYKFTADVAYRVERLGQDCEAGASNQKADGAFERRTSDTAWRHTSVCANRLRVHNFGERKELVGGLAGGGDGGVYLFLIYCVCRYSCELEHEEPCSLLELHKEKSSVSMLFVFVVCVWDCA